VILTTRPVLFYIFRSRFIQYTDEISEVSQPVSPMTSALAEACIQAARISNRILSQLWVDGCLAIYGFYDAVSIFSSTLVLMISSTMKKPENDVDADGIDTAWSLMRSMKDEGNVPINDYFDQLVHLKQDLEDACARRKCFHQAQPQLVGGLPLPTTEIGNPQETHGFAAQNGTLPPPSTSAGDVPNNPFKYASLVQPQANWDPNVFDSILSSINEEQNFWNVNSGNVGAG
jgi:proline utilization trans-activator